MAQKKQNAKGSGTFRYKENGKLEYRICYVDEYGRRKRKSFTALDENECELKAEEFLRRLEKRRMGFDMDVTIPEIVRARYESDLMKNYVGEQGYCRNIGTLRIIEKSPIGYIPIAELTELHIDLFFNSITRYSNNTIGKVYRQIRLAFRIAVDKKIIDHNIMLSGNLRCPKSDKPDRKVRGLTEKEQDIVTEYLRNYKTPRNRNNYSLQLLIEMYTGMRMGEINSLKPQDLDFERKIIHVRTTVSRGMEYVDFIKEGTKTYKGIRDIPMNKMVEPLLKEAVEKMRKNSLGLIFYDHNKKGIIATSQVNCFYRRLCQKCGVEFNGQHSLRHTFATRCIESGIQPIVLKNWLGHKSIQITLDTYADVFDRMNFNAIEKLENYIINGNKGDTQ